MPKDRRHVSHSILNHQRTDDYFEAKCLAVQDMMEILEHNRIYLLKMDVEGVEYEVLETLMRDGIEPSVAMSSRTSRN